VLALFDRQAEMLLARMQRASPKAAADLAHTLIGSARGVGAWKVAAAAQGVELAARNSDPIRVAVSRRALVRAVAEARAAIMERLAAQ
jgi:HPt (histidine-containing phosphotransfer) domain-containing protein